MRCTILPPHILDNVAERSADSAIRDWARRSLIADGAIRITRRVTPHETPEACEPAGAKRTIYDAKHREELPGDKAREEGGEATGDEDVDRIYDWAGVTYDLYAKAYDRDSIDGAGLPLLATVHYGEEYANAFWNGKQMAYGDGDGRLFNSFTIPLDVTAHELTHGVTEYTAGLVYFGQPGALNESVSDVFGVLVKQYHLGQEAGDADWLIGEGLLGPEVTGTALRSMKAPGTAYDDDVLGKDPQPGHMDDYVNTPRDNGGVHINSGIPNRAFYLAAVALGGKAWDKAGRIWYDTLTGDQLTSSSDFAGFASATLGTAKKLYGGKSEEASAVKKAWKGVGIKT